MITILLYGNLIQFLKCLIGIAGALSHTESQQNILLMLSNRRNSTNDSTLRTHCIRFNEFSREFCTRLLCCMRGFVHRNEGSFVDTLWSCAKWFHNKMVFKEKISLHSHSACSFRFIEPIQTQAHYLLLISHINCVNNPIKIPVKINTHWDFLFRKEQTQAVSA